jgi:hypothetical protein
MEKRRKFTREFKAGSADQGARRLLRAGVAGPGRSRLAGAQLGWKECATGLRSIRRSGRSELHIGAALVQPEPADRKIETKPCIRPRAFSLVQKRRIDLLNGARLA